MAMPALDDARSRFDSYAVQFVALRQQPLTRLGAKEVDLLSAIVRTADDFLAAVATTATTDDPERDVLVAWVRLLRGDANRVLAVAGPDASWGSTADASRQAPEALTLTARESVLVAGLLLDPPEPNQHLRDAAQRYRTISGL